MQTMTTPYEAYQKIAENAKKRMPQVRDCSKVGIGKVVRQGDIYAVITESIEGKGIEIKDRQLVPGISNGSRHIVAESPHVRLFKSNPRELIKRLGGKILDLQIGPAVEAQTEWTITHPSHPFCTRMPKGAAQIFYQVDPITKQRAQD